MTYVDVLMQDKLIVNTFMSFYMYEEPWGWIASLMVWMKPNTSSLLNMQVL